MARFHGHTARPYSSEQSERREHFKCLNHLSLCLTFIPTYDRICKGNQVRADKIFLADWTRVRGNSRPEIGTFLGDRSSDGRSLHFTFVVNNNSGIIFEIKESSAFSSVSFRLSDNNSWVDLENDSIITVFVSIQFTYLLSEFRFTLLDRCHNQIAGSGWWKTVQSTFDSLIKKNNFRKF